jgi:hypothetical protein
MLQTYEPDDCCPIGDAIASGALDVAETWECPNCGMEWHPEYFSLEPDGEMTMIKHWTPRPVIMVL